jgi:hypothetical protein
MTKRDYFRFSRWIDGVNSLDSWAEWFTVQGIPWCITRKMGEDRFFYAIWRIGTERRGKGRKGCRLANREKLNGEIVKSWNWKEGD